MTDNESYQVTIVLRGNPNITRTMFFASRGVARKEMDAVVKSLTYGNEFYALLDDDGLPIEMIRTGSIVSVSCAKGSPEQYLARERLFRPITKADMTR